MRCCVMLAAMPWKSGPGPASDPNSSACRDHCSYLNSSQKIVIEARASSSPRHFTMACRNIIALRQGHSQ